MRDFCAVNLRRLLVYEAFTMDPGDLSIVFEVCLNLRELVIVCSAHAPLSRDMWSDNTVLVRILSSLC